MMYLKRTQGGYTLIELLVALSIFAIVMLIATASYLSFINYNRRIQTATSLVNTLAFTIDSMGREIRTGRGFSCHQNGTSPCTSAGSNYLRFTNASGCTITYDHYVQGVNGSIRRAESGPSPACTTITLANGNITDSSTKVEKLLFYVRGAPTSPDPSHQPMVTIVVKGQSTVMGLTGAVTSAVIPFQIQTGATQRFPDL